MNRAFRRNRSVVVAAFSCLLLLASCKEQASRELAEQGVTQFHTQFDSEQYQVIYMQSDAGFRKNSTETDFLTFITTVHKRLGRVREAKLRSSQIGWYAGEGTVVTLSYNTQFEDGNAAERFIWHMKDNRPVLYGYYITSNALVSK